MWKGELKFDYNARRVFVAVGHALRRTGLFRSIHADEGTFRVTASHGWPLFGEDLAIRVVATGTRVCRVEMTSADKFLINIFKWGNNVRNINDLKDFIRNEVYRCCAESEIKLRQS